MHTLSTNSENPTFKTVHAEDGSAEYQVYNYRNPELRAVLAQQAIDMGGTAGTLQARLVELASKAESEN